MKKFLPFILIGAFLFPALGHAAIQTPAIAPITVTAADSNAQFHTILSALADLSKRTQTAMDQLSLNGIDTTQAQNTLDIANAALLKAKITISTPKYSTKVAQTQLQDAKANIILSLSLLKASLSTLDQIGQ